MIQHPSGAIEMAAEAWRKAPDPRVRLFADQIWHTQVGQIGRMLMPGLSVSSDAMGSGTR